MPFKLPDFNLLCNIWPVHDAPGEGPAMYQDVPCQLHLNSRTPVAQEYGTYWAWNPTIFLRMPLEYLLAWTQAGIIEISSGDPDYYIPRMKERMHRGFPNEYLVIMCDQSNAAGTPEAKNVVYPPFP